MRVIVIIGLFLLGMSPARADIDHHCLATCVSAGTASGQCLKQCSYNLDVQKPIAIPAVTLDSLEVHRTFPALLPVGTDEIIPQPPQTQKPPEKDLVCISQCLGQHLQYDYCSQQCVKLTCPVGVVLCKPARNSSK